MIGVHKMSGYNSENVKGIAGQIPLSDDPKIAAWQRLNYGMFIHWGLYSEIGGVWNEEPVTKGYSEQIQMWANIPESEYLKVAHDFTAENFDPDEICGLAKDAGMHYVLMTTKHHDGFCMFDTETTDYNIVQQTPYGKDPLKLLSEACERHGLKFGVYFSLVDWHQGHPFDEDNNNPIPASIEKVIEQQLKELMTNYGSICEIWFDMSHPTLEQSHKFINIVREHQPEAVINSRIWNNMGDFRTLSDNEVPSVHLDGAWQTPASVYNETWGYRAWQVRENLDEKVKELLKGFVGGGNYLLNIGPRGDGSIVEFEAKALREIGAWIKRHPSAAKAASTYLDSYSWGEIKYLDGALYLMIEDIPENGEIQLNGLLSDVSQIVEDGTTKDLEWQQAEDKLSMKIGAFEEQMLPVIKVILNDALQVMPQKTVHLENKQQMTADDFYYGYGYHEQGNYNSMKQVVVRYTTYLLKADGGEVSLNIQGTPASDKKYRVNVGDDVYIVAGDDLVTSKIGPFQVEANQVTPFSITLADPVHGGEPLDLTLESVEVSID